MADTFSPTENCALDTATGNLKEAADILFYESETDANPISNGMQPQAAGLRTVEGRGQCSKNISKLQESLAAQKLNNDVKRPRIDSGNNDVNESDDDTDYVASTDEDDSSEGEDCTEITNQEIAESLPSKTIPETGRGSGKRKRTKPTTLRIEEVEDEDTLQDCVRRKNALAADSSAILEETSSTRSSPQPVKQNPIYYFYESVEYNADGSLGSSGDKHYNCLSGLIGNLKTCLPPMHRLYLALKDCQDHKEGGATEDEISIAAGRTPLDSAKAIACLQSLEQKTSNLPKAFAQQEAKSLEEWDQNKFLDLLASWIVACDQPFEEVDRPEFQDLLKYVHHSRASFTIPGRNAIRRRIMKLGEVELAATKEMFSTLKGRISISLDAWTSPNNIVFLGIVAHYTTNDGKLEELLIDFQELVGEHSGENIAEAVWETLTYYQIEDQIMAFMLDNATNNDTFVDAIKLLEAIGAVSSSDSKKAAACGGNYQDNVVLPLSDDANEMAERQHKENYKESTDDNESIADTDRILTSVDKLQKIIQSIRSSPQRKRTWLSQVMQSLDEQGLGKEKQGRMPILDVRTRWSSMHQMMSRPLEFKEDIDTFSQRFKDLHASELSERDWNAIKLVAQWLHAFREATTQMSSTTKPMLSTTHAVFCGLQDELRSTISTLPNDVDPQIRTRLINAHRKLSDYYHTFDQSPFYTWAGILDPRIMYSGLKDDYANDSLLLDYLESAKSELSLHYTLYYAHTSTDPPKQSSSSSTSSTSTSLQASSTKFNFTARYKRRYRQTTNELKEYLKLQPEDFDMCNPFEWWLGRRRNLLM
ncbi:hypothetical protein D9619_008095 [Psilocybe cf. subviscida]|uniref:HAT C-terminal dimerisation domain-containing protein n=1 Tax=Psilocybe cf. subviscida TaxID=2480587 RepID=A0A8H5ATU8_9AGAR|nr:hypothetical protein D9619_008095 [Psilocybe cf. subviscida]